MKIVVIAVFLLAALFVSHASANTHELPFTGSARRHGMAGTGMSYLSGGQAMTENPAALANIKVFDADLTLNALLMDLEGPANGPNTETSSSTISPLAYLALGGRVHDMITIGLFANMPSGGGASYSKVNFGIDGLPEKELSGSAFMFEFGPVVAINLPYNIKLGVSHRTTYSIQSFGGYMIDPSTFDINATPIMYSEGDLSGLSFTGFKFGVQYDPIQPLHFGLTYRTPIRAKTEGEFILNTTMPDGTTSEQRLDMESEVRLADKIGVGAAYEFIPEKLIVSLEYEFSRTSSYKDIDKTIFDFPQPGVTNTKTEIQKQSDVHTFKIGGEYFVVTKLPIRLGFRYDTCPYNKNYFKPTSGGAPGPTYLATVGAGYRIAENWDLNAAYNLAFRVGSIDSETAAANSANGVVEGDFFSVVQDISLGVNYFF